MFRYAREVPFLTHAPILRRCGRSRYAMLRATRATERARIWAHLGQ